MNKQEMDVLNALLQSPYVNQRDLSTRTGHSLGVVNNAIKILTEQGYLTQDNLPTAKARKLSLKNIPQSAVILAAGYGIRMVPINMERPKALLEVHGELLIERTIRQLHEAGIRDIRVVVGYMKEQLEYLIDEFGVKLVVNPEYSQKNNLHSLKYVLPALGDTYIIPGDIWCRENPYRNRELYSWYMVTDDMQEDSTVRFNRRQELVQVSPKQLGNTMVGISYLTAGDSMTFRAQAEAMCRDTQYDGAFWEEALFAQTGFPVWARVVAREDVVEINTYEQLRNLDNTSSQLNTAAIQVIREVLQVSAEEITDITVLKKGMTNRSFLFCCGGKRYIMRIPGEGTDHLINRAEEGAVYQTIRDRDICDRIAYINPDNGYKITEFLEGARTCNPFNEEDVRRCMVRLRGFHEQKLQVNHTFDIFSQIEFYESLWNGVPSVYRDYAATKENVISLRRYIDSQEKDWCLTHIDAVPDNFLFVGEDIRLIDWEYAGMQDPHVDIAMFCIYAMYDESWVETAIHAYFPEGCTPQLRAKIYCYIAACGLLWSNWCEYKRQLGVEFGEYSLRQYRYAKDYYRYARQLLQQLEETT